MDEDIIVTLKRSNDLLMTFGNDYSDVFLPAIDEIERLREALADVADGINQWIPEQSMIKNTLLARIAKALKEVR